MESVVCEWFCTNKGCQHIQVVHVSRDTIYKKNLKFDSKPQDTMSHKTRGRIGGIYLLIEYHQQKLFLFALNSFISNLTCQSTNQLHIKW